MRLGQGQTRAEVTLGLAVPRPEPKQRLADARPQDGNSIGNSILINKEFDSFFLFFNIELPIELPSWALTSGRSGSATMPRCERVVRPEL